MLTVGDDLVVAGQIREKCEQREIKLVALLQKKEKQTSVVISPVYREERLMVRTAELEHYGKAIPGEDHQWRRSMQSDGL